MDDPLIHDGGLTMETVCGVIMCAGIERFAPQRMVEERPMVLVKVNKHKLLDRSAFMMFYEVMCKGGFLEELYSRTHIQPHEC
jgi:hypothetical protein